MAAMGRNGMVAASFHTAYCESGHSPKGKHPLVGRHCGAFLFELSGLQVALRLSEGLGRTFLRASEVGRKCWP